MSIKDVLGTISHIPTLLKLPSVLKMRPLYTRDCFAARIEVTAERFPDRPAVVFEGRTVTWKQLNQQANRYAVTFKALGLARRDVVSLLMENRIEYLIIITALNKLGVTVALINTNLSHAPLIHCLSISQSRMCIFGEERLQVIDEVQRDPELAEIEGYLFVPDGGKVECPDWSRDLDKESMNQVDSNPLDTGMVELGDIALYIFTSGTTGMPKAAVLSNRRYLNAAILSYTAGIKCNADDRIYLCLPLYHGTVLFFGVGPAFCTGACMILRRKFSASEFLPDVRKHGATCFVYVGELCRYLLNTPEQADDANNTLQSISGNGLRPDVWCKFKQRFGIDRIIELYGSSEGNVGFMNLLNKDCTVGMTTLPIALVKYDVEIDEIIRDSKGFCIEVNNGEPGLLLGKIAQDTTFEGYTDSCDTEKKVLRDAFDKGDTWFNTGDLMKTVDVGFALGLAHYQFVDRVGDTYRWKSENVSTNEVSEVINCHHHVSLCNVYGVEVPGTDGRAGMASIALQTDVEALDLDSFSRHVNVELPAYARPLFLRIQGEIITNGTFKLVKNDLRKQGYDLNQVVDIIYVMKPGAVQYERLEPDFFARISSGEAGY